jgi:hypothetical protein
MRAALGALLVALALPASAASLAGKLPAGAKLLAEADFATLRSAKVVDRHAWDVAGGPDVLEKAGIRFRQDVDRIAVAILPSGEQGKPDDTVALLSGRFDPAKIQRSLIGSGAASVKVGDVPAWRVKGSSEIELHPAIPAVEIPSDQLFVSFLGDLLVLGSERGTKLAHGPKQGVPSPALAAARASIPSNATAWVAADVEGAAGGSGDATAMSLAQGMKTLTVWAVAGDALDVHAIAKTATADQAAQLAGLAKMFLGMAAASPEGKILAGLDIKPSGESVTAALTLTAEQIKALSPPPEPAVAPEDAKPSAAPAQPSTLPPKAAR